MNTLDASLVPKVHPLTREAAPEDPLELIATPAVGDPEVMLECMVQEFLWMGWNVEELLGLFRSSLYPVLGDLLAHYGEDEVRRRIEDIVRGWGVLRFQETIADDPEPEEEDESAPLIQLSTARLHSPA